MRRSEAVKGSGGSSSGFRLSAISMSAMVASTSLSAVMMAM